MGIVFLVVLAMGILYGVGYSIGTQLDLHLSTTEFILWVAATSFAWRMLNFLADHLPIGTGNISNQKIFPYARLRYKLWKSGPVRDRLLPQMVILGFVGWWTSNNPEYQGFAFFAWLWFSFIAVLVPTIIAMNLEALVGIYWPSPEYTRIVSDKEAAGLEAEATRARDGTDH